MRRLIRATSALHPTDRSAEDEIRCELNALLTASDAATLVPILSAQEAASEFGVTALSQWAAHDVLSATLWLLRQPQPTQEQIAALGSALARDAIVTDVVCEQLPSSAWREELLAQTARAVAATDTDRALALAHRLPAGPTQTQVLVSLADECARRDPAAAARWIFTETDFSLRDELVNSAALAQSSTDPLGAVQWILSRPDPNDSHDLAISRVIANWASYAPAESARFAAMVISPVSESAH